MQTGDVLTKDCIMIANTGSGFSEPFVFEAGTVLPSYGIGKGGVVVWKEIHWRGGAIENAKADESVNPTITVLGSEPCPQSGEWEILGTEVKKSLAQGNAFPSQYKNYIWTLR